MVDKIYAVGGMGAGTLYDGQAYNSVECLDPLTGVWSPVAAMNTARKQFGLAALEGRLYAVGGCVPHNVGYGYVRGASTSSVECFDPLTARWSMVVPMGTARVNPGVAALGGKLYAVGGTSDTTGVQPLSSVERFDLSTGQWSPVAPLATARRNHAVAVLGSKLYVVGGYGVDHGQCSSECFDPETGLWSLVATPRNMRSCEVAVLDGKLYAIQCVLYSTTPSGMECFDPETGQWSPQPSMSTARKEFGVVVAGGKLYVMGGTIGTISSGPPIDTVECFDPSTGQWSQAGAMGTARRGHSLVVGFAPLEVPMLQSERGGSGGGAGDGEGAHTAGTGHRDRLV